MNKYAKQKQVAILGGGLAGLAAGYELSRKGFQVTVIEKFEDVGGLARTIQKNGFKFDTGPHRWYTKSNLVNDWMLDLLKGEVVKVPRLTRIYFDHQFFYYPIKLMNALKGIGVGRSVLSILDYARARIKSRFFPHKMITMEDGYVSQFGHTLFETFFKRYSEKLWGTDCKNISVDWVGQRTRGLNIMTIVKDIFFKSKTVVSLVDEFSYPKTGVGRIAEKLAISIRKNKGTILLNSEVVKVYSKGKRIVALDVKLSGKTKKIKLDECISSIPLNELVQRITPRLEKQAIHLSKKLTYRDELQVALFVKKTHITPDTWIYVHPKEIPFMRMMEMDNWYHNLSPKGTTTLVFEIACNEGDTMWRKTDKAVIDLVSASFVEEFNLITREDILGGYVHRVPKEYPVYHISYKEDVDKIKKRLSYFNNLQIVGRNGTFRYNNMDHSIEMGLYSAWNIIGNDRKYDIDSVNIEREYLEEKKIETLEDETVEETH